MPIELGEQTDLRDPKGMNGFRMSVRCAVRMFLAGMTATGAATAFGQGYPNKPIRIVTAQPGGGSDLGARVIAQGMSAPLGQPVIVENRGTEVASEIVARAAPDGYTLLVAAGSLWIGPLIRKTSYDPVKDFSPISLLASAPLFLVVHPSVSAKSVRELTDLAKAKPGALNYSSGSTGAATHLAAELFKAMAGVNVVHVPYKGSGPAVIGLISGQVQMMIDTGASLLPHIKSGKVRALAVTGTKPSALLPDLPTMAASLPGYEAGNPTAFFAPARTPAAIIGRLNQEAVRALNQPDASQRFLNVGVEVVGSSPEQLGAKIKSDMVRWGKLIKDAGIRGD